MNEEFHQGEKTMKRVLTVLACFLTMAVCISALPSCCCCVDADDVLFEFLSNGDGTCSVQATSGFLLVGNVVIPSVSPDGETVTSIADYGFAQCGLLTSVTIPDTVTVIGEYAFSCCDKLEMVNIPNSVSTIDPFAFTDCSSLTMAILPYGMDRIAVSLFEGCTSLERVSIRTSVKYIDDYAFAGCTNLDVVLYEGNEQEWGQISIGLNNEPLYKANIHYNEYGEYNPQH